MFWENMFNTTNYLGMQMVAFGISMQIWFEMFLEIVKGSFVNNYGTKLMTSKGTFGKSIINFGVYLFEKLGQIWDHFGIPFGVLLRLRSSAQWDMIIGI